MRQYYHGFSLGQIPLSSAVQDQIPDLAYHRCLFIKKAESEPGFLSAA